MEQTYRNPFAVSLRDGSISLQIYKNKALLNKDSENLNGSGLLTFGDTRGMLAANQWVKIQSSTSIILLTFKNPYRAYIWHLQ